MNDNEKQFEDFVSQIRFDDSPDYSHRDRLEQDLLAALAKQHQQKETPLIIWRTIMKSRITKLATAAVIVLAVVLSVSILNNLTSRAYAIEQTIKASQAVRYVHYIWTYWKNGEQVAKEEIWKKLDINGDILALRVDKEAGRTVAISEDHVRKEWNPVENKFVIGYEYYTGAGDEFRRKWSEPALAAMLLREWDIRGKALIEIEEPAWQSKSIRVVATYTDEFVKNEGFERQFVLLIDPETKLVEQSEIYRPPYRKDTLQERYTFLEYNQPFEPEMFDIEPPEGAEIIDLTHDIGLPQGDMGSAETAAEVVRRYIQALIDGDYVTAAKLCNGIRPDELKKQVEERLKIKHISIIDIGVPEPEIDGWRRVYMVPFEYEYEKNGVKLIAGPPEATFERYWGPREHRKAAVQPVPGQPDRWVITGGI